MFNSFNPAAPGQEIDGPEIVLPKTLLPWITKKVTTLTDTSSGGVAARSLTSLTKTKRFDDIQPKRRLADEKSDVANSLEVIKRAPPTGTTDDPAVPSISKSSCSYTYSPVLPGPTPLMNVRALDANDVLQGSF